MSQNQYAAIDTFYEFFPSVRAGYRPTRKYGDALNGRTTFGVELTVEGKEKGGDWTAADDQPAVDIRMYGPGDVSGIDGRQVVRVEPEPDTSTMAPNYFPLVEFQRADLPWLFSPERADPEQDGKVRPWMCLVVVEKTNDDVTLEADGTRPLPSLTAPQNELPPLSESWAWAHVQVTGKLSDQELERAFLDGSNQTVSRLVCPRNLDPNTRYVAAVVPTFEPGRRVGLGKEPFDGGEEAPTVEPAWDASKERATTLPVYYQWEFATGNEGDFESLARKLEPRQLSEAGVGKRAVDLSDPGPARLEDPDATFEVGGALMSPALEQQPFPATEEGADVEKRLWLRRLLNEPEVTAATDDSSLPVVGPPVYGQWYLPSDADWSVSDDGRPTPPAVPAAGKYFDAWFHELNVDPRWRIPAGYGTEVVKGNQEALMEAAWKQFGDLEWANERTGRGQLGDVVGSNVRDRFERADDHAVGVADRLRDFAALNREIEAAGRLTDDGALGEHGPDRSLEEQVTGGTDGRPGLDDGQLADALQRKGLLGVDGRGSTVSSTAGKRKLNELRLRGTGAAMRGDGGAAGVADPETLARFKGLTSPTYRRLTRSKGKLDRGVETSPTSGTFTERLGESFSFDTDRNLGSRFARVSDRVSTGTAADTDATAQSGTGASTADTTGDGAAPDESDTGAGAAGTAAGPGPGAVGGSTDEDDAPSRGADDWRLDARGQVVSLAEAAETLDGAAATVPKALLAVEGARDHCATARRRLADLESSLAATGDGFSREVVAAVTERPTVEDHCDAVRYNTFDTLDRQFGKLVAADPPALDDEFTTAEKEARLGRVREAHGRLSAAARYVTDAVRSGSDDPVAVREKVGEALAALDDVEAALDDLSGPVSSGIPPGGARSRTMRTMSAEVDSSPLGADSEDEAPAAVPTEAEPTALTSAASAVDQAAVLSNALDTQRALLFEGTAAYPGQLDAGAWAKKRAAWDVHPGIEDREVELGRIMAAPEFDRPMYEWLKDLDEQYLLPGVEKIQPDTVGALQTNSEFIESFMCGLNHEMARELRWRRYPTDRRGTYFRQFWKYIGNGQKDVTKLHTWADGALGDNRADGITDDRVVLLVRGDLLRAYPNTRIYAVKAVKEDKGDGSGDADWDRVPLLESLRGKAIEQRKRGVTGDDLLLREYDRATLERDDWDPREPVFSGKLDPDITFLGFDLAAPEAEGETIEEGSKDDLGWFFVLEERVGETRFGFDVAGRGDYGSVPHGVQTGPAGDRDDNRMDETAYNDGAERGWNGLSWGHLVAEESELEGKKYVRVTGDRPSGGDGEEPWEVVAGNEWNQVNDETWNDDDAAEWGRNSAHMARIAWQLPVRVCIHGDDILPELSETDSGDGQRYPRTFGSLEGREL